MVFFPMQGRVIILRFNSSIHGIYVILVPALSANVTLNHSILMEKRARGPRNGGECVCVWVCVLWVGGVFVDEQQGWGGMEGVNGLEFTCISMQESAIKKY